MKWFVGEGRMESGGRGSVEGNVEEAENVVRKEGERTGGNMEGKEKKT